MYGRPVFLLWCPRLVAALAGRLLTPCPCAVAAQQKAPADDPFPTTGDDLQGFWDMVLIQVHHINDMMEELDAIRANNWQLPEVRAPRTGGCRGRPSRQDPSAGLTSGQILAGVFGNV